jgi:hypothetical protein
LSIVDSPIGKFLDVMGQRPDFATFDRTPQFFAGCEACLSVSHCGNARAYLHVAMQRFDASCPEIFGKVAGGNRRLMPKGSSQNAQGVSVCFAQSHCAKVLEAFEAAVEQVRLFGKEREVAGIVQVEDAMIIGPAGIANLRKDDPVALAFESPFKDGRKIVRFYLAAQDRQLFHHRILYKLELLRSPASLRGARGAQGHANGCRTRSGGNEVDPRFPPEDGAALVDCHRCHASIARGLAGAVRHNLWHIWPK